MTRISVFAGLFLSFAACSPKGPAPKQCASDSECFSGGVCNAGGTCVTGAAIDKDKSTVDISQATAIANGKDEVTVTVTLKDSAGNALSSRGVLLSVDGTANTISQPSLSTDSLGVATGKLTSTKAEDKQVTVTAGVVIGNAASTGVTLTRKGAVKFIADKSNIACPPGTSTGCTSPADANSASVLAITDSGGSSTASDQPLPVVVDPAQGVKLKVVLKDASGNPIPGVPVSFSASGLSITRTPASGSGTTGIDGSFTATLTSTVTQTVTLVMDVGGIHVEKVIKFMAGPAAAAHSSVSMKVGDVVCGDVVACDIPLRAARCSAGRDRSRFPGSGL